MITPQWSIRAATGLDLNFIYATWVKSFWSDSECHKGISAESYFKTYPKVIDHLLSISKIAIACDNSAPEVFYGYMVAEPPIIHYCFVKEGFRRFGIMRSLMQRLECGKIFTHRTGELKQILRNHPEYSFNPYLLYTKGDIDYGPTKETTS